MKTLIFLCLTLFTMVAFAQPDCVPITVSHSTSSGVAPVSKIVLYNVVTGVPGEEDKCWITSNLGSDHEAAFSNDISASGWYWQFNRKQGYAYDGTTRVPASTWDFKVSDNSNWTPGNDPCAIELGAGWHVPTLHEWSNVDNKWYNWGNAFASPLKLSASGYLYYRNGNLMYREKYGMYWSNEQSVYSTYAYNLQLWAFTSNTSLFPKSMGQSIRCVK